MKRATHLSIAAEAKHIYDTLYKAEFEAQHRDRLVAIEPVSKSHFLADEFIDAALAAKRAYPDRPSIVIRIGHETAFDLGNLSHPTAT